MINVKVNNVIPSGGGNADYKGLDLEHIVPGSQVYLQDTDLATVAYFKYKGDIVTHSDVSTVTEAEYLEADAASKIPFVTPEQKAIDTLKADLVETQNAVNFILLGGL